MVWYDTFNDVFFISIATIISGFLGLAIRYCFKSKCEDIKLCWGFIEINRNVLVEEQLEMGEDKTNEDEKTESKKN